MENTDLSNISDDILRDELKKRKFEKDKKAIREKNKEIMVVYHNCLGTSYVKEINSSEHHITYRNISNVSMIESGLTIVIRCDEHGLVVLSCRTNTADEYKSERYPKSSAHIHVNYSEHYTKGAFLKKETVPISEEEYNKAKEFAIQRIKQFNDFFEKD
jgi:hypothetical protein